MQGARQGGMGFQPMIALARKAQVTGKMPVLHTSLVPTVHPKTARLKVIGVLPLGVLHGFVCGHLMSRENTES